ncbi:MAG: hypothetical protein M1540_01035 [Candidatus Bathyarchaeota archaeon]|nr:hypothetical protein [Candidatus Bathyarchaeota archaeon]
MNTKTVSTCPHIHIQLPSTWNHVSRVKEIAYATPKQKPKHVANPKRSRSQLQSCGVP